MCVNNYIYSIKPDSQSPGIYFFYTLCILIVFFFQFSFTYRHLFCYLSVGSSIEWLRISKIIFPTLFCYLFYMFFRVFCGYYYLNNRNVSNRENKLHLKTVNSVLIRKKDKRMILRCWLTLFSLDVRVLKVNFSDPITFSNYFFSFH